MLDRSAGAGGRLRRAWQTEHRARLLKFRGATGVGVKLMYGLSIWPSRRVVAVAAGGIGGAQRAAPHAERQPATGAEAGQCLRFVPFTRESPLGVEHFNSWGWR